MNRYLKNKYIPSGNYFISGSAPLALQAILGTCVGVAVYDRDNAVGGLIHLLLPEPVSMYSDSNLERYASTGLPVFLKSLLDAGACRENMMATIAGGALVGPVTAQDLSLDIGGHTVDIVKKILKQNDITIEKSETGGFFSCRLGLDLHQWHTSIEPAGQEHLSEPVSLIKPDMIAVSNAIENLLPIPQVALKVMRIMDEDTFDMSIIAKEVGKDQVLTARTLKLCNSAIFARRKQVESIEDALIFLGKNLFIQIILSAAIKNYFNQCEKGYSICKGGLYHHAVGTAVIAEKLAVFTGSVKPTLAYIAGLMHDIGKVVLDRFISATYPYLYRNHYEKELNLIDIEKEYIGIDHTEVGYLLALRWGLPDIMAESIKNHHHPMHTDDKNNLSHIVFLADLLMSRFNSCIELERMHSNGLNGSLEKLGISPSQFTSIVDLIPNHVLRDQGTDILI